VADVDRLWSISRSTDVEFELMRGEIAQIREAELRQLDMETEGNLAATQRTRDENRKVNTGMRGRAKVGSDGERERKRRDG
jgi:hypothetical protein